MGKPVDGNRLGRYPANFRGHVPLRRLHTGESRDDVTNISLNHMVEIGISTNVRLKMFGHCEECKVLATVVVMEDGRRLAALFHCRSCFGIEWLVDPALDVGCRYPDSVGPLAQ